MFACLGGGVFVLLGLFVGGCVGGGLGGASWAAGGVPVGALRLLRGACRWQGGGRGLGRGGRCGGRLGVVRSGPVGVGGGAPGRSGGGEWTARFVLWNCCGGGEGGGGVFEIFFFGGRGWAVVRRVAGYRGFWCACGVDLCVL